MRKMICFTRLKIGEEGFAGYKSLYEGGTLTGAGHRDIPHSQIDLTSLGIILKSPVTEGKSIDGSGLKMASGKRTV